MTTERKMESETLGKLGEALAKAQGEMESASKDSTNPHFRSKYADLASIREAVRKPLSSNGLSFFQRTSSSPEGVTVETTLLHSSGEFVRDSCWLPVAQQTAQAFGSALTYARRYSLAALIGVVADDDDDGNAASSGHQPPPPRPQPNPPAPKVKVDPPKAANSNQPAPRPRVGQAVTQEQAKPPPAPEPTMDDALKKFKKDAAAICEKEGHSWDLKTQTCNGCGAKEPKEEKPKDSKLPVQSQVLRAKITAIWKNCVAKKMDADQFQKWAASVIGRDVKSTEWTQEDTDRLWVAHQEPNEPGANG